MRRAAVLLLFALLLGGCAPRAPRAGTITVAAVLPLSGEFGSLGRSVREGIELALDEASTTGVTLGDRRARVVLRVEDDRGDPSAGEAAVRKLGPDVTAVIGGVLPEVGLAVARAAEAAGATLLVLAVTDPAVTQGVRGVFRVCFDDEQAGAAMATYAVRRLSARRAAIIYDRTAPYNTTLAAAFRGRFRVLGGSVVGEATFEDEGATTDFTAPLERLRAMRPDVVFSPNFYRATAAIAVQAARLRLPAALLSGEGANSPDFATLGGESVEGAAFPVHYAPDDPAPASARFRARYGTAYGRAPDAYAALGYDAGALLLAALRLAGTAETQAVRAALGRVRLDGATGAITFHGAGTPAKDVVLVRLTGGRAVFVTRIHP